MAQPQREDEDWGALQHAPTRQVIVGPIRLGGTTLGRHRHICAFFNSHDDHYRVLLPFIKDGFDSGEKAVHIIDPRRRADHIRRLSTIGIDATAAQDDGRLDLREWADAHLRDGLFDQDRTLHLIDGIRQRSAEDGFPRIRFVTHMEWALEIRRLSKGCWNTRRARIWCRARIPSCAPTTSANSVVMSSSTSCAPIR